MPQKKMDEAQQFNPEQERENMRFYAQVATTPEEAKKPIGAGRLKGYTDINPMYRIQRLTQLFGPAGIGWWTQNVQYRYENASTGEIAVFCSLELVYVDPMTGTPSMPVYGVGGNKFVVNETKGAYCNDEAQKMAYTDALSIACKSLGFCHDVYYSKDRTKYSLAEDEQQDAGDYAEILSRIQNGIKFLTKDMTKEEKEAFTANVIVKNVGSESYVTCKDVGKLNQLLKVLLSMAEERK